MATSRVPYPAEFRSRILDLVRAGRTPEELAEEYEPTAQTIRNGLRQAELDPVPRQGGLTSDEKAELLRLRRENARLREEREILEKAAAWFASRSGKLPKKPSGS